MKARHALLIALPAFVVIFGAAGVWQAADGLVAQVHYGRAYKLASEGRYEQAIQEYDKTVASDPSFDSLVRLDRARAYAGMGNYAAALAECDAAIRSDSDNPSVYVTMAQIYMSESQYQSAVEESNRALALTTGPSIVEINRIRGSAYVQLKDYPRAISDLNIYLVLATPAKGLAPTYETVATLYGFAGQNDLAVRNFSQAIKMDPKYATAYYNRGFTYKNMGNKTAALADFRKFLNLTTDPALIDEANQQIAELQNGK